MKQVDHAADSKVRMSKIKAIFNRVLNNEQAWTETTAFGEFHKIFQAEIGPTNKYAVKSYYNDLLKQHVENKR